MILVLLIHTFVSLCLLASVLSVFVPASVLPIPTWFGLTFEWQIIAELVTGLPVLCSRYRRWSWLTLVVLVMSIMPISYTVSHKSLFISKCDLPHSFTLMSYNTRLMGDVRKPKNNRVIQYIQRAEPDVVCLQEVEVSKSNAYLTLHELREALRVYPYTYFDFKIYNSRRQYGNAVFSKYPLINKHTLHYESRGNITSVCDIVLPTDTLRLYTNHLESNRLQHEDFVISATTEQTQATMAGTSAKLEQASEIRIHQAEAIREDAQQSPYPVLIVGDMNTTPVSFTYRILQSGMRDAFLESSNFEFGHTFVKKGLGIRIDYILHSKQVTASGFEVAHVDYSDHYPIRATIHY